MKNQTSPSIFISFLVIISLCTVPIQSEILITKPHKNYDLVDIKAINPHIVLDIRYATTNNFTKTAVYQNAQCFVHTKLTSALDEIQKELETQNLGLKIYDGYRPLAIQQKFWDMIQDKRYVSNPAINKGRHTRGTAVDVTLVEKYKDSKGKTVIRELDMPTEFDNFTAKAHPNATKGISKRQIKNRRLLKKVMGKHGFKQHPSEWWHFDWEGGTPNGWKSFKPLNVSFDQLGKKIRITSARKVPLTNTTNFLH